MEEIRTGVWHWTTMHETIGQPVHSYFVEAGEEGVLIDPRVPEEGLAWFEDRPVPAHALLTNRHHHRHSERFRERFGTTVWCNENGMHEFDAGEAVEPFAFGTAMPGGFSAVEVGALCAEETAFHRPASSLLAVGDAVIEQGGALDFVPDPYIGDDPPAVKAAIRRSLAGLLELDFDTLLMAHGAPIVGGAKERLVAFVEG